MSLPNKICFVDTETTGASLRYGRIIEIGIIRVENEVITKTFSSLINPNCYLPEEITALTGITQADLEKAPSFYEIYQEILETLEDSVFVAHNVRFDYSFLKQEFKRLEKTFSPRHFCTVKLSRTLFPEFRHHNLDALIERFNLSCQKRHRALEDAQVLWQFYQKIRSQVDEKLVLQAVNKSLKKPTLPINLSQDILDNLPEAPGVYIFYGKEGMPLYVGKSINIKERVLSHFSADISDSKEMNISQQVESIETIQTAGELGALIKESYLVKKLQPLYNRKLRLSRKLVILKSVLGEDGYQRVELDNSGEITVENLEDILGIFKSKNQAKNFLINCAKEHFLCEKLLGIEKTNSGCFGYRLGRCKGACIKKEKAQIYNLRMVLAFSLSKLKKWPFEGPVLIKETNEEGEEECFILDKWCFLGSFKKTDSLFGDYDKNLEYIFDLDTYKILNSFLNSEKNLRKISKFENLSKELLNNESYKWVS